LGQTLPEAAHDSEIVSVDVRKPSPAKGLLRRGFLNPSVFVEDHRCSPELGLVCPQKLPVDQFSSSGSDLSSLVGRGS
jgi:hypothetical protein